MKVLGAIAFAFVASAAVGAQTSAVFEDGDTVVFLGDSITHGGRYHEFLTDYYRTRYPERKIRLVNSGLAGDAAHRAFDRVPVDVGEYNPTWVFLHFGMNDIGRYDFTNVQEPDNLIDASLCQERFRYNFTSLLGHVHTYAKGAKNGFLTPTLYDDTARATNGLPKDAKRPVPAYPGCAAALSLFAGHVLWTAHCNNAFVVNWFTPMQKFLWKKRTENDWMYMLTGFDRVHPNAMGNTIMALEFLKAQGASAVVSDVTLDASGAAVAVTNAAVSRVEKTADGLAFDLLENALPFPLPPEAKELVETCKPAELFNTERLAVKGLAAGRYALLIDGKKVGEGTSEEFAAGVELGFNAATPQYAQAQEVFRRTQELSAREVQMRNSQSVRWVFGKKAPVDDMKAMAAWYEKQPNKKGYFEAFVPGYIDYWPRYRELREELWQDQEKVRAHAKPVPHRYEIRRK